MALDLEPSRDLTLIFERDDVQHAFTDHHVGVRHEASSKGLQHCEYCQQLLITLATAILEWKAICDQERAQDGSRP